ncbi:MAG: DUF4349 domain-containing protein [Treponema sp.]|jgi:hypothetical protein|nr:DUF4349 domain-containing protein [Treponema sp.]
MKRKKTIYRITMVCFAAAAFAVGSCSARGASPEAAYRSGGEAVFSYAASQKALAAETAADDGGPELPEAGAVPGAEASRKLVYRANISIRVQDPEKAGAALTALMERYGAYASSVNIRENSRHYTIRVPAPSYTALLSALDGMGRLLHRSESAEDVTLRYYDLEGRLATKRELLKTYQSYLGRAKNIEEILAVEAKIAELEDDIDGTGKELRSLAGMVDYATVDLEIQGPENIPAYAAPTLGERIAGLFGALGDFFSTALVILLGIIVYGIPSLLVLALLFWVLFGRIGLLKKLWRLAAGKKDGALKADVIENKKPERE